jgi:hypothetical protein
MLVTGYPAPNPHLERGRSRVLRPYLILCDPFTSGLRPIAFQISLLIPFAKPNRCKNTATGKADTRRPIAVIQIPTSAMVDAHLG